MFFFFFYQDVYYVYSSKTWNFLSEGARFQFLLHSCLFDRTRYFFFAPQECRTALFQILTNRISKSYKNFIPYGRFTNVACKWTSLTLWRWNYFFSFSTPCIQNVNNTGTKQVSILKQTAFWREKKGEYRACLKYSVTIFVE